jgi:hypothetical protein
VVTFRRNLTADVGDVGKKPDAEILAPGEYVKVPAENPFATIAWAFTCCPGCAHIWTLSKRKHQVDASGVVTPSDVCPNPDGCSFHEFIALDGWSDP